MHSPFHSRNFLPSLFERLEDRVLFDGVPDAAFILPTAAEGQPQPAQLANFDQSNLSSPRELIIIDAGVEDSQQLLLSLLESNSKTSFEIRHISQNADGVDQITELLNKSNTQYDAIHILSHGEAGSVALGSSVLNQDNVFGYLDSLASWSDALSEDADILFYGCELAGSESGQSLIQTVSSVTGADVAASVDVTGSADQNANWNLEFSSGRIETIALSAMNWDGTLMVEATNGAVTIQDAEASGSGTVSLVNNAQPESVTVINTPTRVGQMLERIWEFNETGDVGRSTFVFDVSMVSGINATIASEFGLIVSDQFDLADGPNTTTLVASGYDDVNKLVYFHQVDLNDGDYFGLATEVVQDNFSLFPTATGLEDSSIDLGLVLSPSLTQGGQLQDIIATDTGFRGSSAGTASTDFLIPAGTTGVRITGFSTRDIGTSANDLYNDDYQFLNVSIDLGTETSNGYIGHIIDQGPNRSDQFGWDEAPLGTSVLTGGGNITGDANDNIDPTFTIIDGVLMVQENHSLQTAYHVEYLTNATSSSEFIRTESTVLESGDQSVATLTVPANADFLVVNITDAAAGSNFAVEYKGNSRVYIDLATLRASGVVAAEQGETDTRVVSYAFEDYDVSSAAVGSILSAAGTVVGDTAGLNSVINDNQIYLNAAGDLVIDRSDSFATSFNSLVTVEYYERRDFGSSAEQLGQSTAYGFWNSDPSNPTSTLEFDIPENAALGILNLTANGTNTNDTNENSGAAFAVIDLVNGTSSGSLYFVRASRVVDLVGWDETAFGTSFFDDPNSISNHNNISDFNDPFGGTAAFNLTNGGTTIELAVDSDGGGTGTFLDYYAGGQIEWFGAAPFEVTGSVAGGSFSQGALNPVTGNWELTIAQAQAGLAYIPPTHVSGTVPVDVTLRIGDESEVTSVTIQAVIDPISFMGIPDACGDEDTDISIAANVTPTFVDQDGSETITSLMLSNIPIGHTISDGTNSFTATAASQSLDITAWNQASIVYRANPNESGTFTIDLDVDWQDVGGGVTDTDSMSTTFEVVVKPINDDPVAVDNNYTVLGNTTLNVPLATGLLINDSDADGDPLTVTAATPLSGPSNGSVTVNSDGTFSYTPTTGFSGLDQFTYQVSDGNGGFDTAIAFIDVSEPVTGPLDAIDDTETTNEETSVNIDVMANDALPTTGAFNIQSTTPPSNGTILVLPDGTIDYTPNTDFFGTDTFTYTLADASGRTDTATVTVTVVNVQDPPVANADSGSTNEDTTLPNIDILNNDSDPDNDTLTVTTAIAANGTVVINPDGTIDYTPNPNFNGVDTVNYTISDGNGGTASSTVLINVVPVSDPPTSADRTVGLNEDSSRVFSATDFAFADPDVGDSLVTVRIDTLPASGQLLISGNPVTPGQIVSITDINNGRLVFVPDPDGFGSPYTDFDFSVSDGTLYQVTPNTMTINVLPRQDPPVATDNSITVPEDSTANPLGLAPPTDIDGDTLTATVTGLPTLGTVFLANGVTPVNNGDMLTVAQLTSLVYGAPTVYTVAPAGSFTYDVTDGIDTDSGQVDITITPVNDPPIVDLNNSGAGVDFADTFTEGGSPVGVVDPTVEVTDEDDTTLPTLKIDVDESTIVDAGDEYLTIGGTDFQLDAAANSTVAIMVGGVSYDVSFVAATARLDIVRTDSAEMTIAEVEAILADTTYRNDSLLPTVADRVFDVCVNDGDVDSNIATSTISVVRDVETADWSITGSMMVVDGGNAAYVVTLSNPLRDGETASVDLALADVDTTSADYGTLNAAVTAAVAAYSGPGSYAWNGTTLTFTSDGTGVTTGLNISLPTTPDGIYEGDEDYTISLSSPGSTTGETIGVATPSVTTTIKDNTPAPTISINDGSATEGSPVEFLISLDVASFEDIVLDLAASSGSATAVADFETTNFEYFDGAAWQPAASGTQITIPAGTTSLQVRVDTVQEGLVEPDETFTLGATVVSGAVTNASDTGTGTIVNDDNSLISIDDVSVDEDNGTMTFTISLDQSPTGAVSVDWATSNATATGGIDFTSASGTANFAAGQQTQTVTISIANDNLYEGPETFNVDLSNASGGTIVDAQGVGTIFDNGAGPNGSDDDRPVISIDDVVATEGTDTHAEFTISLSNPSVENIVVSLALADVSAVNPDDYGPGLEYFDGVAWQSVSGNVTIPAGATSLQVRTPIVDDPYADSGETYSLVVTRVSGTTANTGDTGTGTILDELALDATEVSITGPASVTEGSVATYTVAITNAPLTDVTVTFTYTGTASGGMDYAGVASVTIPAGSTSATFDIPTIDDTLGEPLENFTVAIDTLTGGSLEALNVSTVDFEVTTDIIDDDVPAIMVSDVIVTEGTDPFAQFTVELSNPTFEDIDFDITAIGLSATGEAVDYGIIGVDELEFFDGTNWVPATAATIVAGDTTILLRTPIIDDALAEMTETFNVTVTTTGGTTSNPSDSGVGTIQEDTSAPETILVSLTGPGSVVEGATTTAYTISLTDSTPAAINAAEDITVTLVYTGTAADGSDFTGVMTVLIPAGSPNATFTLPTVNDSLYEDTESIIVTIDSVVGGGFEGIGIDTMADEVTTLIDDSADIPTVSVNDVTSIEDIDNFAVYTIELTNLSVEDVDVSLLLADGTGLGGGVDYGAAAAGNMQVFNGTAWVDATTATIPAGSFTVQVRTPIVSDLIDEPTENYTLTVDVTAGTTTNIQVIGTGTIIDDDPAPDVTIDDATSNEGDPLVFNVALTNPSSQPIVLDFTATDTTAIAPGDYDATTFEYSTDGGTTWLPAVGGTEVTIPANMTAIQVRVMTTEDMTLESTETMQLGIASVISGLVGNTTDTAVGTILDDDSSLVSIVANDPAAGEPANNGQFTVSMTNPSDSPTVIAYSVAGSATNGGDYSVISGTVTIPAGQTSATIDVTVSDDVVIEGNEDVIVMLTSITSGDPQIAIDLSNDIDSVIIADDDEATWDLTGASTVNEGANATYTLNLDGTLQSGESASVELSIGNNTTAIADYASFNAAVASAVSAYSGPGSLAWDGTTLTFTSDGTGAMNPLAIDLMAINDAVVEGVEDYTVSIAAESSSTGATIAIDAVDNSVTTQIQDTIDAAGTSLDKATWSIAGATSVNESQVTTYTVTIDAAMQVGEIATVEIALSNVDTVAADLSTFSTDVANAVAAYNASGQPGSLAWDGTTLTFTSTGNGPMGDLDIQVTAVSDGFLEVPEDYSIQISNAASTTGACVAIDPVDTVTTTIISDTTAAEWSIGVDNAGDEGDTVQYTIALSQSFGAGNSAEVDLTLSDVDTNSADYANFVTAVNTAVAAYAGPGTLAFDGTTLTFTATADGDAMTDLVIDLQLQDDAIVEGTETFTVDLSNAAGPVGINVSVSTTDDSVTTTINDTMGIGGTPDVATWSIAGPTAGDEGTTATYTVSLAGALGDGESASVVIDLNDLTTNSSDHASIVAAVTAAAAANPDVTFNSGTGTLTYIAPSDGATMTDLVINLGLATDAVSEGPENFEIGLSSPASTTGAAVAVDAAADLVNTTINDLTTPPEWAITGPVTADEAAIAQYTVTLNGALGAGESATVEIELTDLTTNPNDHADIHAAIAAAISSNPNIVYDPVTGTITFTAIGDGASMPPIVIDLSIVNDALVEGPEQYSIGLSNPGSTTGGSTVSATDFTVTTTINDTVDVGLGPDQATWSISGDTTVGEGNVAQYSVGLAGIFGAGEVAEVNLVAADVDTTSADYASFVAAVNAAVAGYAGSGTLAFDGTTLTFTSANDGDAMSDLVIDLMAIDDTIVEGDEDYTVSISSAGSTTGASVAIDGTSSVTTTITDNDTTTWSITGDVTVGEGASAEYTVALAGTIQTNETATIDLGLANVDTTSADYAGFVAAVNVAVSARSDLAFDGTTLTFTGDGMPMMDLVIDLGAIDDTIVEGDEDYTVSISNPASTTGSDVAVGGSVSVTTTITDNDTATWSISGDPVVGEGATAQYMVDLAGTMQNGETATIDLGLSDVDTSSTDYANFVAAVNTAITGRSDLAFDGTTLTYTGDGNPFAQLTIDLAATDDGFIEGDEDYTVSISNPASTTGGDVTAGVTSVTTTITDNDTATWDIFGSPTVGEGGTAQYNLFLSGTLQAGETATIDLGLSDVDTTSADYANFVAAVNTAIAGRSDLAFDGTTLTYTGDGNPFAQLTIDLAAIDDVLIEGDEDYTVSISNPASTTGGDVTAGVTSVTTTITDNDTATWDIFGSPTVGEGATAQYNLFLSGTLQSGETATIDLGLADVDTTSADYANFVAAVNTAITGRSDLAFDGTTLTYTGDGNPFAQLTIDLAAIDDVLIEGVEDYTVSISNPASTTGGDVGAGVVSATTTIIDNDSAAWSITGDPTVAEGATAQYTVALAGTLQVGEVATIDLGLADVDTTSADYANFVAAVNTAIAGRSDLSFDGTTLTYTGDGMPMTDLVIDVAAIDDMLTEGNEDYAVAIANPASTSGVSLGITSPASVTTTIIDNDAVQWSIVGDTSVDEGGTAQYTIELDGVLQAGENAIVQLDIANLETSSADYANFVTAVQTAIGARTDLSFDVATGQLTATGTGNPMVDLVINLGAADDAFIEGPERYQVLLSNSASTTGAASSIDPARNLVTTTIDDTVGDGGVLEEAVWSLGVDQTVPEGTPGAYTLSLGGVLQAGETVSVELGITDIDTVSGDYASFNAAMSAAAASYVGPGSVNWNGTTFEFTSDGTGAMASVSISLGTINDAFAEGTEDFVIALTNANSSTGAATSIDATQDDAVTTIDDTIGAGADDLTFEIVGDTTVDEGGTATYTVTTTGGLGAGENATVDLLVGDTDTNSADYAGFSAAVAAAVTNYNSGSNPGSVSWDGTTLTFTAAVDGDELTGLVIDLGAIDDAFLEGPEVYDVSLTNAGSTSGVTAGIDALQNIVVTTINDTDGDGGPAEPGGEWSLVGGGIVNEGAGTNFTLGLSGNLQAGEMTSVQFGLSDIETVAADYDLFSPTVANAVAAYNANATNSGSLAWDGTFLTFTSDGTGPMNDLQITLDTVNDTVVEGDERFNALISNPRSTTGLSPSISSTQNLALTTIIDNDSSQWEITGDTTVGEGASAEYTVTLSGTLQSGETSTIDLGLADVDTTSSDYANFVAAVNAAISGRSDLAFDGTTLTYTGDGLPMADLIIDLDAIDDTVVEGDEDYTVSISNPGSTTGADVGLGGSTAVTTTITDNDNAIWAITGDTVVPEGATAQYTVTLSGVLQAGETASIDLGLADVDTSSADYINFVAAVNAAVAPRPDLAFDGVTVTFTGHGAPMGNLVLNIFAIDDPIIEGDEDYTVSISNPVSTTGSDIAVGPATTVTTTITDNDTATWSITGDPIVAEGATAQYTVALAGTLQAGETATIELGLADIDTTSSDYANFVAAVNAAILGRSDLAFDGTTLTYTGDGNPMADLIIGLSATDDTTIEGDEDYRVSIANSGSTTGSMIAVGSNIVTTTITDNDTATWSISGDATVGEGAVAKYTVALAGTIQAGETATIELAIGDIDTASADYASFVAAVNAAITNYTGPGAVTFDGTTLTFTSDGNPMDDLCIELTAVDDLNVEGPEDYTISIAGAGSTTGSDVIAGGPTAVTTTITDNDTATWNIAGDATVVEGATAQYTIELDGPLQSGETATIELSLGDIDTNSSDYAAFVTAVNDAVANYTGSGTLSFDGTTLVFTANADGDVMTDLIINLDAVDDVLSEGPESYVVSIANPGTTTGGDVVVGPATSATTTIIDNDPTEWSISGDATVDEGGTAQYTIALDGVLQLGEDAIVELTLANIDTNGSDYANFIAAVQVAVAARADLSFDPATGRLTATGTGLVMNDLVISIDADDDTFIEGPENYQVLLSNATSTTGLTAVIDPANSIVTTTIRDTVGDGGVIEEAVWSFGTDQTVDEGASGSYALNLGGNLQAGEVVTVDLTLTDLDTVGGDYDSFNAAMNAAVASYAGPGNVAWDGATFTFTSDGTGPMASLPIVLGTVNDPFAEGAEDFRIAITNAVSLTGASISIDATSDDAVTTIDDTIGAGADDVTFAIVGDTSVDEGGTATYTITTTGGLGAGQDIQVDLSLGDIDTNSADYANFNAAVVAAVANYNSGSNSGSVSWDGTTLMFTAASDGDVLAGLVIDLVANDDSFLEGPESYDLTLDSPSSADGILVGVDASQNIVLTTINDTVGDGGPPEFGGEWSLTGDTIINEGDDAIYTIGLTGNLQAGEATTTQLSLADVETNSSDYSQFSTAVLDAVSAYNSNASNSGSLSWDGSFLTFTSDGSGPMDDVEVTLTSVDDVLVEGPERFNVVIANASSSTGLSPTVSAADNLVNTTIIDNDPTEWSISGPSMTSEGNDATYTVSLDGIFQAGEMVSVSIGLTDIDTNSSDYGNVIAAIVAAAASNPDVAFDPATGIITYTAPADGATMADLNIDLPINSDGVSEPPEDFVVSLSNPTSNTGLLPTIDATQTSVNTTINGSPVLQPDSGFTSESTPYFGNVLSNDSDPDGDQLTVTHVDGQPISSPIITDCGTVVMNPNGTFTFTPNPGFFGVDTFTYTVVDSAGNTEISTVEITVNGARVGVAKAASDAVANGEDWDITFTLVMENLGNVSLNNLRLTDDVQAIFGNSFVSTSAPTIQNFTGSGTAPTLNANWAGNTSQNILSGGVLEVGASFEVTFTVTIDPDAGGVSQMLNNQAEASGQGINPDGTTMLGSNGRPAVATDVSDDGTDPAGDNGNNSNDDTTQILIADLGIAKTTIGDPELLFNGNFLVTYRVVVENTGTVAIGSLSLLEDLTTQFGSAYVNASDLDLVTQPANTASNIAINSSFNGGTDIELMSTTNSNVLAVGDSFVIEFVVEIDPLAVNGTVGNQISGSGAAVDANGNQLLDSSGDPIVGSDLSDSGTDPGTSNPDDPYDTGGTADASLFEPPELPLGEISGTVFYDFNNNGVRESAEDGIEGVEVMLLGTDVYGNPVSLTSFTDADGQYSFTGLNAGIYRLVETQPEEFDDGIDTGEGAWTIGDDEFSNIVLNWGQAFTSSTFAERFAGTSGFPPNYPPLAPISSPSLSNLIDNYAGSASTIYSGIPIGSNANPLWLVSGRPIQGGYSIEFVDADCGCEVTVDAELPCDEPIVSDVSEVVVEQVIGDDCLCEDVEMPIGEEIILEGEVPCAEIMEIAEIAEDVDCVPTPVFLRGTFLQRMANWLKR